MITAPRARSSAGRAPRSQCGGREFDPLRVHQFFKNPITAMLLAQRRTPVHDFYTIYSTIYRMTDSTLHKNEMTAVIGLMEDIDFSDDSKSLNYEESIYCCVPVCNKLNIFYATNPCIGLSSNLCMDLFIQKLHRKL